MVAKVIFWVSVVIFALWLIPFEHIFYMLIVVMLLIIFGKRKYEQD